MRYFFHLIIFYHVSLLGAQKLCSNPDVTVMDGNIQLNPNEQILVCGSDKSEKAWRKIPLEQAQYHLNVLLQAEGYLNSTFENDGQSLKVYKGKVTNTEKLILSGQNGVVDVSEKRKIIGNPMTPKKLDEVKDWAELAARRQGYPCPEVQMHAEAWNRTMFAKIETGSLQKIGEIRRSGFGSLDPEVFRRYEAFESGDLYDIVKTQITVNRVMSHGLFQNAYITTDCGIDTVDLDFRTEVGKPRLLRYSFGASTEEFPFADAWFKNSHLDNKASSFLAQLHASGIRQSFELTSEFYIIPGSYSTFVGPNLKLERRKELAYESNKSEVGVVIGKSWDVLDSRLSGSVGPTFNYLHTVAGNAPEITKYLTWDADLSFMNHSYEAFRRNQAEGWIGDTKYIGQRKGIGAQIDVDRFEVRFKNLYNVRNYSPPLAVVANRLELIVLDTHGRHTDAEIIEIPVDMRIFYGGSDNIRGFSRQILNNNEKGFLTSAYLGTEVRIVQVVPHNLEPLVLFDVAKLGARQFSFMSPTFLAYGAGLRWMSPLGTLRASAARGQIVNGTSDTSEYPQEWVYHLSFGQEF